FHGDRTDPLSLEIIAQPIHLVGKGPKDYRLIAGDGQVKLFTAHIDAGSVGIEDRQCLHKRCVELTMPNVRCPHVVKEDKPAQREYRTGRHHQTIRLSACGTNLSCGQRSTKGKCGHTAPNAWTLSTLQRYGAQCAHKVRRSLSPFRGEGARRRGNATDVQTMTKALSALGCRERSMAQTYRARLKLTHCSAGTSRLPLPSKRRGPG